MQTKDHRVDMPTIPSDRGDDFHNLNHLPHADLVLFLAGNQFMVMGDLLAAFQKDHPEVKRIFYETLPPGLELKQILAGGAVFRGAVIEGRPDVYASVTEDAMRCLEEAGLAAEGEAFLYLHNRIVLMVPEGNPLGIHSVMDLARDDIRVSQPNPEYEDIAHYIVTMYRDAGGDALVHRVMEEKRADGTAIFTIVHHRETPLRIGKGNVDVGPVWATEVIHARNGGLAVEAIEPGEKLDQRDRINYYMCKLKHARNEENADKFTCFIRSDRAQNIYKRYGFVPHKETSGHVFGR